VSRFTRPILPLMMKSAFLRRQAWRIATLHGDRLSVARSVELTDEALACTIAAEIFNNADEFVRLMDPLPCPVTIAWGKEDVTLPLDLCEPIVREMLPCATFTILPDVAHAPMLDDPELVARTILDVTTAAKDRAD
jgi:pimeloyl-ACP methyl ester carboxylesterase